MSAMETRSRKHGHAHGGETEIEEEAGEHAHGDLREHGLEAHDGETDGDVEEEASSGSVTPVTTSRPVVSSFLVSVRDLTCVMECTVEAQIQGRPQMEVRPVMRESQNMSRWYAPGFLRPAELFTRRVVMFWSM